MWKWTSNFIPHCSGHRVSMIGLKLNQCSTLQVEVYPNICPVLMDFLYFYLPTGHFEITITTNSSDLENHHIKKTRPAWLYCMTTKHTSCDLTHEIKASSPAEGYAALIIKHVVSMTLVTLTSELRPLFPYECEIPAGPNRVPSSFPVRRIPRQDLLHTTGWESLTNTITPKDAVNYY